MKYNKALLECHVTHLKTSHVTRHTSHVTRHTSHVTPHTSHLTPHTSHLTPHTSHNPHPPPAPPSPPHKRRVRMARASPSGPRCRSCTPPLPSSSASRPLGHVDHLQRARLPAAASAYAQCVCKQAAQVQRQRHALHCNTRVNSDPGCVHFLLSSSGEGGTRPRETRREDRQDGWDAACSCRAGLAPRPPRRRVTILAWLCQVATCAMVRPTPTAGES